MWFKSVYKKYCGFKDINKEKKNFYKNVSNSLIVRLLKKNREKLLKRWAIKLFGEFRIDAEFEKGLKTGFTSFTDA